MQSQPQCGIWRSVLDWNGTNMNAYIWIGQAIGVLAMLESFFIFQVADRRKMVLLKLVDDVLWIVHFILIGGYTGALTTTVALFREIVFYFRGEKKWASSLLWAVGFSIVFAASHIGE